MPSIEDNLLTWNANYDWPEGGHEWSVFWGGTDVLWGGMLAPRIRHFLPAPTLLEIAPGFGRITSYLIPMCDRYIGIDLAERCVLKCSETFADESSASFHTTDGYSLESVDGHTIDFTFSFDSLVHAEADVLEAYAFELARVLKPGGAAFLHHSNVGAFTNPETGEIAIANDHWRGTSMSAERMREYAAAAGIHCRVQELLNWGSADLTDCFSLLVATPAASSPDTVIFENPRFMDEALALGRAAKVFDCGSRG